MRLLMVFGIALALAGCDKSEEDARRALTAAQVLQNEGRFLVALDAYRDVIAKWPKTAAAGTARQISDPLVVQRRAAEQACDRYALDVGAEPTDVADFYRAKESAARWSGPYATLDSLGPYGRWVVATGCGLYPDRWPSNDQPRSELWAKREG